MIKNLIIALTLVFASNIYAQDVFGVWATLDKNTGKPTSNIKIFKATNGKVYGKIVKIMDPKAQNDVCTKCKGDKKDQPILNLVIITDLTKDGNEYKNGKITDTRDGKVYDCAIWVENGDLKLRGYWGIFYQTETWVRVE